MTRDTTDLLRYALRLPQHEQLELAARLNAGTSSVVTSDPEVLSGAPVFHGTRVLVQTLLEQLEAGDSIDDFLEGFPSVSRDQVIAFLEEMKWAAEIETRAADAETDPDDEEDWRAALDQVRREVLER